MNSITGFLKSTILSKLVMAVTGILMVLFLVGHLTGNLLIFAGPEKLNQYAQGLRDLGPLLWVARIGLVVVLVLHVITSIQLADKNRQARPVNYNGKKPIKSTLASRTMLLSGLTIFFFVIYHLLHYTFGLVQPDLYHNTYKLSDGRVVHDVYTMVIYGFTNPVIVATYILGMIFVSMHISHAVSSAFQTLGVQNTKFRPIAEKIGPGLALFFLVGYLSMPIGVFAGLVKHITTLSMTGH